MRRALALLAVLALCALAGAPVAQAWWAEPQRLTSEGAEGAGYAEITADGDVIASWYEYDAATRDDWRQMLGVWPLEGAPARETLAAGEYSRGITTDASGNAIAWHERVLDPDFHWRERPAGGSFGPEQTYTIPTEFVQPKGHSVAQNEAGDVALVWQLDRKLFTAIRLAGGDFGPPQELAEIGPVRAYPQPRLTESGELVVVWASYGEDGQIGLRAVFRSPAGVAGDVQTLSTSGLQAYTDTFVADDAGNAVIVWHEGESGRSPQTYRMATRAPGAAFAEYALPVQNTQPPRVAITDGGIVTLAVSSGYDAGGRIYSGRVGAELELIQTLRWAPLAIAAGGENTVVVASPDLSNSVTTMRTGEGLFGPAEDLRPDCGDAAPGRLSVADDGRRVLVWMDGLNGKKPFFSRGDGAPGQQTCMPADAYSPDMPPRVTNPPPRGPAASGGSWLPGEETWGLGPQPELPLAALSVAPPTMSGRGKQRRIALSATCGELCYAFGTAHVIGPSGRTLMKKTFYGGEARDGNLRLDWKVDLNAKARRRLDDGARAFKVRLHMRFGDAWNRRVPRTYEVGGKASMSRSARR